MVAFIGRPVETVRPGKRQVRTTFRVEERLWGVPAQLHSIDIEGADLQPRAPKDPLFVLAGRRANGIYFQEFFCCPFGLLLRPDHKWVKEFRDNVAQRKSASMQATVQSNFVPLSGFRLKINRPGFAWEETGGGLPAIPLKVAPGEYDVGFEKPHFRLPEAQRRVSLLPGSCTAWRIEAEPASMVSGRIRPAPGVAAQHLYFQLDGVANPELSRYDAAIEAMWRAWYALTRQQPRPPKRTIYKVNPDSEGNFRLHVLPGTYRLSAMSSDRHEDAFPPPIPRTYYPGTADRALAKDIVVTADGGGVGGVDFRLPDYGRTRRVEVVLTHQDGRPASNQVVAHTGKRPGDPHRTAGWAQKLTDAQGQATFELWQALDYQLHVASKTSGDSTHISAGSSPVSLRFVLDRNR